MPEGQPDFSGYGSGWSLRGKPCLALRLPLPQPNAPFLDGVLLFRLLVSLILVIAGSLDDPRSWDLWNVIGQRRALGNNDSFVFLSFLVWWPRSQQCWVLSSRGETGADEKWLWAAVQGAWLMVTKQHRRAWVQIPASAIPGLVRPLKSMDAETSFKHSV